MAFNPYDYQRYFDALEPSQRSAVVSGTISVINETARNQEDAERARRRVEEEFKYRTSTGFGYPNPHDAWQQRAQAEGYAGRPDCGHGFGHQ